VGVSVAVSDVRRALGQASLAGTLGWQDVKQRYRRSKLGPFWLTISMAVLIATIGVVFGQIFRSPMSQFLPFLALGIILWTFIASVINEGCVEFVNAEGVIKQLPLPWFLHSMRVIWRNGIILAHNAVIVPLLFLVFLKPIEPVALLAIPGLALVTISLGWMALLVGIVCTRYRDLAQIIASVLQIAFYVTPIIWMPTLLSGRASAMFLTSNPFYHLLEVVRAPLLGDVPTLLNWGVCIAMAVLGWLFTIWVFGRYRDRMSYWL
jgi:lipopolysaccharide transport system permease protein